MPSIVQVDPEVLKELLTEVKETVANYIELPTVKREFRLVDMWKIRRNGKSASERVRK